MPVQAEPKASPNEPSKPNKPNKPHKPHKTTDTPSTPETPDTTQNVTNPKTGDDTNILVYVGLAAAMTLMIIVIVTGKYRKKKDQ